MKNEKIYEMVTNQILERLEKGVIPWRNPMQSGRAVNWKTQKPYRGINTLLLGGGEWATFKQIKEAGGKVKKGEKSSIVIFWKWLEFENEEGEDETKKVPLLRYYRVFEINSQVEGMESKRQTVEYNHNPIEECEAVVKGYIDGPNYTYRPMGAWYRPSQDLVNVPPMKDFGSIHEYYSTLFHEMIHSTGHYSRLNREGIVANNKFGSETYSKEELVAELGASMLCATVGIENYTIDNSASYIQSWMKKLKEDNKLIVQASQQAQKATDRILGIIFEGKEGA